MRTISNIVSILNNKDIVEYIGGLELGSSGEWRCKCPIHHGENESSFVVFPSHSFYCFSCGAWGRSVIDYVMQRDKVPFDVAVTQLAEEYGLTIDSTDGYVKQKSIADRNKYLTKQMVSQVSAVKDYLHLRGFNDEAIKRYRFGYSTKQHCLSIPFLDVYRRYVGFCFRYFSGKSKYKNSKNNELFEKGSFLYNEHLAQVMIHKTRTLYLVEGCFDSCSGIEQGLATVAYCGITLTKSHVQEIKKMFSVIKGAKVICVPDADGKANKFVSRARVLFKEIFPECTLKVAVINPLDGKDFNDLFAKGLSIAESIEVKNIDLYCAEQLLLENDDEEVQEKLLAEYMKTVSNPMSQHSISEMLSKAWNKDVSLVRQLLSVSTVTDNEKLGDVFSANTAYESLFNMKEGEVIKTGFYNIDEAITMIKTDVTIIAAYSFMGKTSTLCQMILDWVIEQKKRVLFFSMEMPKHRVMQTLVAQIVQTPRHKVVDYIHSNPDTLALIEDKLSDRLFIVDRNDLSMNDIEEYLHLTNIHKGQVDIVCVDYFGYLRGVDDFEGQEASAKKMKAIAKRNNILFVMLAQLNKASQLKEGSRYKEPTMNDIKGAGGQGASADTILLLWKADSDTSLSPIDREKLRNISYIKIGKCRESKNGNTLFQMKYNPDTSLVEEYVGENFLNGRN